MSKYKVERNKFIKWLAPQNLINVESIKSDLIISGEAIITASTLLAKTKYIPAKSLIEDYKGDARYVNGTDCELIYKEPFE